MKCPLCSALSPVSWVKIVDGPQYWICSECELVWLAQECRPTRESEEMRYRTHQNDVQDPFYIAYLSRTALPLVRLLPAGARGLDYGCGPTEGMKAVLSPQGFTVESYDPIFFPQEHLLKNSYDFLLCS